MRRLQQRSRSRSSSSSESVVQRSRSSSSRSGSQASERPLRAETQTRVQSQNGSKSITSASNSPSKRAAGRSEGGGGDRGPQRRLRRPTDDHENSGWRPAGHSRTSSLSPPGRPRIRKKKREKVDPISNLQEIVMQQMAMMQMVQMQMMQEWSLEDGSSQEPASDVAKAARSWMIKSTQQFNNLKAPEFGVHEARPRAFDDQLTSQADRLKGGSISRRTGGWTDRKHWGTSQHYEEQRGSTSEDQDSEDDYFDSASSDAGLSAREEVCARREKRIDRDTREVRSKEIKVMLSSNRERQVQAAHREQQARIREEMVRASERALKVREETLARAEQVARRRDVEAETRRREEELEAKERWLLQLEVKQRELSRIKPLVDNYEEKLRAVHQEQVRQGFTKGALGYSPRRSPVGGQSTTASRGFNAWPSPSADSDFRSGRRRGGFADSQSPGRAAGKPTEPHCFAEMSPSHQQQFLASQVAPWDTGDHDPFGEDEVEASPVQSMRQRQHQMEVVRHHEQMVADRQLMWNMTKGGEAAPPVAWEVPSETQPAVAWTIPMSRGKPGAPQPFRRPSDETSERLRDKRKEGMGALPFTEDVLLTEEKHNALPRKVVERFTTAKLKAELRERNFEDTGTREELIDRLVAAGEG
eukprot:TRINITY_DN16586_c1_g2_i1.p1 TRINITY_DN16586_c1_g2~~TRINITY_DN16586_c1_g2_i1.p1  ORF type:complete len:644 (+),score=137.30 TRINITY_DN16586_c1_g2_i1:62-1993(+)